MSRARRLPRAFFDRDTQLVARELLGKHLVHVVEGVRRVGRIVETEAYLGPHDLAAHSARGLTPRTQVMSDGFTPYSSSRMARAQTLAVSWYSPSPIRLPLRSAGVRMPRSVRV